MAVTANTIGGASTSTTAPLPVASTIDGSVDLLAIYTASATAAQAISRNTLLGLTSQPVGLTDAQALTNKTIGNTNTLTIKDSLWTLQNASDTTKQANFSLASLTTGTTRTYTLPNFNATLSSLAGTETLTNKTLTSPTITAPTITNATITTDAITGFTVANTGTIYGLSVSTGVLSSANVIPTAALQAGAVTNAKLAINTVWNSFTPSWTNLSVGTGGGASNAGFYQQVGKLVTGYTMTILGSSGASVGTTAYFVAPVINVSSHYISAINPVGSAVLNAGAANSPGLLVYNSSVAANALVLYYFPSSTTLATTSSTTPGTWAPGNVITTQFMYEVT